MVPVMKNGSGTVVKIDEKDHEKLLEKKISDCPCVVVSKKGEERKLDSIMVLVKMDPYWEQIKQ
jgi:hypothetical protein